MKVLLKIKPPYWPLLIGLAIGTLAMLLTVGLALAVPAQEEADPTPTPEPKDCQECHLDIADSWSYSPHAHAYDDPVFQESWIGLGKLGECLMCHTTNYQNTDGIYSSENIECEACHGQTPPDHPPAVVPVSADTNYCGTCHTTTISEWQLTGHAAAGIGCSDCHDPHSQQSLFEDPDDMCLNCHEDEMGDYLEDLHVQNDIGCVDCHALVIPPEVPSEDGIVPTGHTFTITPATCVACHTDTLHAGFSLPGYENGAKAANENGMEESETVAEDTPEAKSELSLEQQVQAMETALASRNLTALFQGAVIGLTFGGTTAWIAARNVRQRSQEPEDEGTEEES